MTSFRADLDPLARPQVVVGGSSRSLMTAGALGAADTHFMDWREMLSAKNATAMRIRLLSIALCAALAGTVTGCTNATTTADPAPLRSWQQEVLVPGSSFHTVNGLALDRNGEALIASVASESIYRFDPHTKTVQVAVPAPEGLSDDIALSSSGNLFWTDPVAGVVRTEHDDGTVSVVAENLPGVNSIAFSRDGRRLFVGQTFFADSFWEIDPEGRQPPRLVAKDTEGVNAFAFGADGFIYGPIAHDGTVVRMDPETGEMEVLVGGLKTPVSVRWSADEHLYVLAGATGEVLEVDPHTGSTTLVAQVAAPVDNMVVEDNRTIYVTNMADNAVIAVDIATGATTSLIDGVLAFPKDVALVSEAGRDVLYVADSTAVRSVDTTTGDVTDLARRMTSALQFPSGIGVDPAHIYLVSEVTGSVQIVDRRTSEFVGKVDGFVEPTDVVGLPDGIMLVAEGSSGRIVRVDSTGRTVIADGLIAPMALVSSGNGSVYLAESTAGRVLELDVDSGSLTEVAAGFGIVRSIGVLPDGRLAVLDSGSGDLHIVDPLAGKSNKIASTLPVGYLQDPYPRSGGIVVGSEGTIYVAADRDNSILKLTEN